jgi:transcriptional regulator with XRE-family HTH domain
VAANLRRLRARGVVVAPDPSKVLAPVRARSGALHPSGAHATLSIVKTKERVRARELRRSEGWSIKQIARELAVSRSSVSLWVRDIELTEAQRAALLERNPAFNRQHSGWLVVSARRREARLHAQEEGRALARRGDPLHIAGCMFYWAEGSKSRNALQFCNSDPEMVRFFLRFLRVYFPLRDEEIRVTCYLYADHERRQQQIEEYWLSLLGLDRSSLCRSVVNRISRSSKGKRFKMLPYGTCRTTINRTAVVQSVWGSIQEYAGFRRDSWLE